MEYKLDSMLDNIESKLNLNSASSRKSFQYRIKSNLSVFSHDSSRSPFGKEQALRDSSSFNQNHTESNYRASLLNTEAIVLSNNSKEIRRILQRELEPYLSNIKAEIKMALDHFHREVECYNTFLPKMKEIREEMDSIKRQLQHFNENSEMKLIEQRDRIIELSTLNVEVKEQFTELKYKVSLYESDYKEVCDKLATCEKMRINYVTFDEKIRKYYTDAEEKLSEAISKRIEGNALSIGTLQKGYDCAINSIARLESEEMRISNVLRELDEKNQQLADSIKAHHDKCIANTAVVLKTNEEVRFRFEFIERKASEITATASNRYALFKKDITALKEDNAIGITERKDIIETLNALIANQQSLELKQQQLYLRTPINHTSTSLPSSMNKQEIESKLFIIEEMLNEHHKLLLHLNSKSLNKIPQISTDKAIKSTKEIAKDDIITSIISLSNT